MSCRLGAHSSEVLCFGGGDDDCGWMTRRVGSYYDEAVASGSKCRFANARPEPDFKQRSNLNAVPLVGELKDHDGSPRTVIASLSVGSEVVPLESIREHRM